ncbi:cytosine permease, partial [Burkholderia pseudomallei]
AYGSVMSVATIVTGFSGRAQITQRALMAYVLAMVAAVAWLALVGRHAFLQDFSAFILCLLALFSPWSSINLDDFYWV